MREGFASYSDVTLEDLLAKIEAALSSLPKQEAKVAQYFLLNLDSLSFETGRTIARKAGVAEITVGRMLRRFGCAGMKEFRSILRQKYAVTGDIHPRRAVDLVPAWRDQLAAEMSVLQAVYDHLGEGGSLEVAARHLSEPAEIFVTGFQSVRGLAEDTCRRLSLARTGVRFLSPHDGMLGEWIDGGAPQDSCLLIVDVVPYAAEARSCAQLAREQGRRVVIVTDEYCHWAGEVADVVINVPSATGLFLESPLGLVASLHILTHIVAESGGTSAERLKQWKRMSHRLRLF